MSSEQELLHEGFARFVAAARDLERGYAELKARAAAIDLELQASNLRLEAALAERDAVFAALPVGLCVVRPDGTAVRCNREAERLLAAAHAAGLALEHTAAGEVAFGGSAVRVRRVALPEGELVLLEDRSRLLELEREVHRLDRLAGLSELALGIAHEIKNPLNGVQGFAALLERSDDPAQVRRFAGKIVQGVRQVDEIVKALLGFARPTERRGQSATLTEVATAAAQAAGLPAPRLQLTGSCDERVDAEVMARVLGNLLRNALEACPTARVQLHAAVRGTWLDVTVRDDGPGVPAQLGTRALEPFVSTKERGTGLGLALCQRVLAFLGGELELTNAGQPGACFRVRVPRLTTRVAATPAAHGGAA